MKRLALALLLLAAPAAAQDATVYSGGAVKTALTEAIANFERATGKKIAADFHPMGPLLKKLEAGEAPDIVVLSAEAMQEAAGKGWVDKSSIAEIGRVGIGVAVHESAPSPDIATPEAFKRTLLAAKSIVYIDPERGTSGRHFAQVLKQLGIEEAMKPKTRLGSGGFVVEPVGRGEIELGVHQITEILPVKGVKLVGPLPSALQKVTIYQAALTARAKNPALARDLIAHWRDPEARRIFAAKGFIE